MGLKEVVVTMSYRGEDGEEVEDLDDDIVNFSDFDNSDVDLGKRST